jgi:4-amino-4-deoxy-L-arabinose transferase-like glycosyltransferase
MKPAVKGVVAYALTILIIIGLRLVNLNADPPSWLSWSSGIYSDEGIYAGDARSAVLFGHWSPGDFHSAEIAPLHHLLLLIIFHIFGVSLITARALSVVTSLITLALFYLVLRKEFDERTAFTGLLFLGLSPVFLFYNRLALLETPTVCLFTLALYLVVVCRNNWLSGIVLGLALIYKPLALLCVPAFFTDLKKSPKAAQLRLASFGASLLAETVLWTLPHRRDLTRLNRYYLLHQYLPHTVSQLKHNIVRSLWSGSSDGILPFLIHHAPILLILVVGSAFTKSALGDNRLRRYALWLILPSAALCLMSYEPSRYFILFWPALAAIAAVAVTKLPANAGNFVLVVFVAVSSFTSAGYLHSATYDMQNAGVFLGQRIPKQTLVAGQYAPEFALSNRLPGLYVQPGLANSQAKLQNAIVLVTVSSYWSDYWHNKAGADLFPIDSLQFVLPHNQEVLAYRYR